MHRVFAAFIFLTCGAAHGFELGGASDPFVGFPDKIFVQLGIYGTVSCIWSDLQVVVGTSNYNWSGFDQLSAYRAANHLKRLWYGGYIGSGGLSDNQFAGQSASQIVQAENNFLSAASKRDQPEYIILVNEALPGATSAFAGAFGGAGSTGVDWIINLSKVFRQYFPNARLGVNDLDFESSANDMQYGWGRSRLAELLPVFKILHDAGAIDWVGEEGYSLESCASANLLDSLNQIWALGLHVVMTEFSPDAYAGGGVNDDKVLSDWQRLLPIYATHPAVELVIGPWDYRWSMTQNGGVAGSQWFVDDRVAPPRIRSVVAWIKAYLGSPPPSSTPSTPTPTPSVSPSPTSPAPTPSPSSSPPLPSTPTPTPVGTPPLPSTTTTYHQWQHWLERAIRALIQANPPIPDS